MGTAPVGTRLLTAFLIAFLVTVVTLVAAGYAITRIPIASPREIFRAGPLEFDLAPGWWCERDSRKSLDYACSPPGKPPYSAAVLVAVKDRSTDDTLQAFENHLKQLKRTAVESSDAGEPSVVRYVKRRKLGDYEWVEALYLGSEIAGYHTYYLATTTSYLAILVTLSVHKDYQAAYMKELNSMMSTLNIYQR
jgi:hypothetical protein